MPYLGGKPYSVVSTVGVFQISLPESTFLKLMKSNEPKMGSFGNHKWNSCSSTTNMFQMSSDWQRFNPITFTFIENSNYGRERCKGKRLLDVDAKFLNTKSLLTMPSSVLPLHFKQTFPTIIWIFTEGEGDEIESSLLFKIFSTLI